MAGAIATILNGLYILLVAIGNITDYDTNFAFVQHVLTMDTTNFGAAPGTDLDANVMWRAITVPAAQTAAYFGIIAWEAAAAVVLGYATIHWIGAFRSGRFAKARHWSSIGLLMIVGLFMGGFITIGGEWFQMWRSVAWNGLDAAFRNAALALLALILVHLTPSERQVR